jgi:hypothetical protein
VVFPEVQEEVSFFFTVLVNAEVDLGGQCINIFGHTAARIKGFGIAEVIHQLHKIPCGFIGISSFAMLYLFPARPVFLYKKAFSQVNFYLAPKIRRKQVEKREQKQKVGSAPEKGRFDTSLRL